MIPAAVVQVPRRYPERLIGLVRTGRDRPRSERAAGRELSCIESMFSRSTTASIRCIASGLELSLLAATFDAPRPVPRRFRRLLPGQVSGISALRSASPLTIENRVSLPILRVRAFRPVDGRVGSEEARRSADLRPPLKLAVRFSRNQLSQRLAGGEIQEKESMRPDSPSRVRHKAGCATMSSSHCNATVCDDATRDGARSSDPDD